MTLCLQQGHQQESSHCWQYSTALLTENSQFSRDPSFLYQWQHHPQQPLLGYLYSALFSGRLYQLPHMGPLRTDRTDPLSSSSLSKSTCKAMVDRSIYYRLYRQPVTFNDFIFIFTSMLSLYLTLNAWPSLCYGFWGILQISHPALSPDTSVTVSIPRTGTELSNVWQCDMGLCWFSPIETRSHIFCVFISLRRGQGWP